MALKPKSDDIKSVEVAGVGQVGAGGAGVGLPGTDRLSLDLQFATDKTLTARKGPTPVFTRASTATFVGSDGLIQSAAINEPRFDHDPITLACKGLLIEESRTNVALYSGQLVVGTGWSASLTPTVTSIVDGLGPDGNNAYEIAEIANTGTHTLFNTGGAGTTSATSVVSGTAYTGSIFVKKVAGSVDWIQLSFSTAGFGFQYANFNISNGTIGNVSSLSPRIQDAGNGWYRCSISTVATTTTATTSNLFLTFTDNTDTTTRLPSYAGNTANKFLASLCQFEAGSFPTSYIPTTTASVVRSVDLCSITGSDFTGFYNQPEGTYQGAYSFISGFSITGKAPILVQASNNTFNERNGIVNPTSSFSQSLDTVVGATFTRISTSNVLSSTLLNKVAGAYKAGSNAIVINNGVLVAGSPAAITSLANRLDIGNLHVNPPANTLCGHIASIRYYKKRLSNAKLQSLTV